jgi:signal transduction histidine kinase
VLMLTALVLPSTGLPFRRALAWGFAFTLAYLGVAVYTELDPHTLESTIRLETIATHLMVPLVVVIALAYAADVLERLRDERLRSERLAVESERQRIAWELHDSAKQRVHAAHLVLSALQGQVDGLQERLLDQALSELRAAGADMDTSVAELLGERAAELARVGDTTITVDGELGELPAHVAAHVYRIGAEALTNAVRHGGGRRVDVMFARDGASASVEVIDDGRGLAPVRRPGANGLRSMQARADTIGAALSIGAGPDGRGTRVVLSLPAEPEQRRSQP